MMPDEHARWMADHPEVMTAPIPEGWNRLDSAPLRDLAVDLLHEGGAVYRCRISNAHFIISKAKPIAWRQPR